MDAADADARRDDLLSALEVIEQQPDQAAVSRQRDERRPEADLHDPGGEDGEVLALGRKHRFHTAKQRLAAIRMMFDWLATGGILPFNPASAVRGPKHVVKRGKTPVLATDEARQLLDAIHIDP